MSRSYSQPTLRETKARSLRPGDVGVVVHVHPDGEAYVVEFLTLDGDTAAIATVLAVPGTAGHQHRYDPRPSRGDTA